MNTQVRTDFDVLLTQAGGGAAEQRGLRLIEHFGDWQAEYVAARQAVVLVDDRERGLIEVGGADRAAWLNNLVTNTVKPLTAGEGNYAFATQFNGRVLFELNLLVGREVIRIDLDRRAVQQALAHFNRYLIAEDVTLTDRSATTVRLRVLGPRAGELLAHLGAAQADVMADLGSCPLMIGGVSALLVRHGVKGYEGFSFIVEASDGAAAWQSVMSAGASLGIRPAGWKALETLRIEAGLPAFGAEIDGQILPADTGQAERGVSYVKGCYLGQEVVERMRAHGGAGRAALAGLRLSGAPGELSLPIALLFNNQEVGRLTSVAYSPGLQGWIGLGYVRLASAGFGSMVMPTGRPDLPMEVIRPFRDD